MVKLATSPRSRSSRRGQSMVEFAVCLPFLLLLLGALVDFGFMLHTRIRLTAAARVGAQQLLRLDRRPNGADLRALRAAITFAARDQELRPEDVRLLPAEGAAGFWSIELSARHKSMSPVRWSPTGEGGRVGIRLLVPVGVDG